MRAVTSLLLAVAATLTGCDSTVVSGTPTQTMTATADVSGLIPAEYPQCDRGAAILEYLATGDNGGDPGMDQLFAEYVGTTTPQARALASDWIEACNEQYAEQEAAEASAAAAAAADAQAAASASEARAESSNRRACEAIGGSYRTTMWDGVSESTVEGNPSGQSFKDCGHAWITFPATEQELAQLSADYPGCF